VLFLVRHFLDVRIEGYLHRPDCKIRDPWMADLARLARRHRRLMDVVVSPHAIAHSHYARHNLALLEWQRQKPFLVYHQTDVYSPWHYLPVFFAPKTQTIGDLHAVLRLLKAVIRVEVPRLQIPAARWNFLDRSVRKLWFRNPNKAQR